MTAGTGLPSSARGLPPAITGSRSGRAFTGPAAHTAECRRRRQQLAQCRAVSVTPARRLILADQLAWHPTAVSHLDALRLGPLTNLGRARSAARILTSAAGGSPPGGTADLATSRDVLLRGLTQRLRMGGAQVNLVLRTIETKVDGSFCLTAVEVIDEQGLYLLGHACSDLRVGEDRDKYSLPASLCLANQENTREYVGIYDTLPALSSTAAISFRMLILLPPDLGAIPRPRWCLRSAARG